MPKRLPRARTLKGEPKLSYYDAGGGLEGEPPILLIHASLYRSEDWENIFPRLATRYRVISYDQRGHGRSERAASYELRSFADDAMRVLREVVKAPAVVIGHSLGALAAVVAAAEAPELVRALILEDPPLKYGPPWERERYQGLRDALDVRETEGVPQRVESDPPLNWTAGECRTARCEASCRRQVATYFKYIILISDWDSNTERLRLILSFDTEGPAPISRHGRATSRVVDDSAESLNVRQ